MAAGRSSPLRVSSLEEKFRTSKRPCNIPFTYFISSRQGAIQYLTISCYSGDDLFTYTDNMLSSHVMISCFRAKVHLVMISLVFI